jgi:peptidoglycan/LPS O-acetylase OafA/YrhL
VPDESRQGRPPTVAAAAVVQAVQSAAILLAAVLAGLAAIEGKSYQNASGIAITAIGAGTAMLLGLVALGLARTRRWSRTPALLTQLFTGIIGIYLVQGHRWSWGVPAIALCVAGFVLLLSPPSTKALTEGKLDSPASPR